MQNKTTKNNKPQIHSITWDEIKLFQSEDLYNQNYLYNLIQQFLATLLCSYFHRSFHTQTNYYKKKIISKVGSKNYRISMHTPPQKRKLLVNTVSSKNKVMFKHFSTAAGFLTYQGVLNNKCCTTLRPWSVRNELNE